MAEIDALARVMNRARNDIVNQAIEQCLRDYAWQMERVEAGMGAARNGRVNHAHNVFDRLAEKHGWAH